MSLVRTTLVILMVSVGLAYGDGEVGGTSAVVSDPVVLVDRGRQAFGREDYAAAVDSLEQAVAILGNRAELEPVHLLAESCYQLGELSKARRWYRRAIELDDKSAWDHFGLGNVYVEQKRFGSAMGEFWRAAELGLIDGRLHYNLARCYHELDQDLGLLRYVEVVGGREWSISGQVLLMERVAPASDKFLACPVESAAYQVQRALDLGTDNVEVRLLAGEVWLGGHRYERAAAIFDSLSDGVAAEDADFHVSFAEALYGADDMEGYIEQIRKAVSVDRVHYGRLLGKAYYRAASRYCQRGDLENYLTHLQVAVAELPDSADLYYQLGNGLWEAGKKRPAAMQWRRVLEMQPDHRDRVRMLELIRMVEGAGK